jgi:hypothetical protein
MSVVLVSAIWSIASADAGAIYKISGIGGYTELELTFEGGKVVGQARPLRGLKDPPQIDVTGANSADGVVDLTFHATTPQTETFRKSVDKEGIT